jgi:hypothetical protein
MSVIERGVLVLTLMLFVSPATAADLAGTVRHSGQPQPNVEVKLRGPQRELAPTTSNNAGKFVFVGIPPGEYTISCGGQGQRIIVTPGTNSSDCNY